MKARVTLTFSEEAVATFAEMFDIEDYSKLPTVLEAILRASLKTDDDYEQIDNLIVEMIECGGT